jgi:large subunit ribosomal protein L6
MSRIGKKPIIIPAGVEVRVQGSEVSVKGPKGQLTMTTHPAATVTVGDLEGGKAITIAVGNAQEKKERALWGTTRALIANMIKGVTEGFSKSLEITGVGFRASVSGKKLMLTIGFSHDVEFPLPEGIAATVEKNVITVSGIDRQLVGETAAQIRGFKKPEPYLGKGIKYTDEVIRRKAGKAASKAAE